MKFLLLYYIISRIFAVWAIFPALKQEIEELLNPIEGRPRIYNIFTMLIILFITYIPPILDIMVLILGGLILIEKVKKWQKSI